MRVRFRNPERSTLSRDEASFFSPQQTFLSSGKDYVVHAVSVYRGVAFVQIVDDDDTPVFLPRALFETVATDVPHDWICSLFPEDPVQLVLGPAFMAKDLAAYEAMVDQERAQVERFWGRIESADERTR
jgi:hypothetical protein